MVDRNLDIITISTLAMENHYEGEVSTYGQL